jgi:hypothetical protein
METRVQVGGVTDHRLPQGSWSTHAQRREAVAQRISAAETLLAKVDQALATVEAEPGDGPSDAITDPLRLLQGAARLLLGLAGKTPGSDLLVSVGPKHLLGVRLHHVDGELRADLVRTATDRPDPVVLDVTLDPQATVSTLASMLWSGELGSGGSPVALPSKPQETGPL